MCPFSFFFYDDPLVSSSASVPAASIVPSSIPASSSVPPASLPSRRSSRTSNPPPYLQDYVSHSSFLPDSSSRSVSSCASMLGHQSSQTLFGPNSYSQADAFPQWQDAMRQEFTALEANNT